MPNHEVGKAISDLIDQENWTRARKLIEKELEKSPNHHWLLDRLSLTYYEQRDYPRALELIERAHQRFPGCPLVLWDLAGTLDAVGRSREALFIFNQILRTPIEELANGECGEGADWARSLLADCVYRMGVCYQHLKQNDLAFYHYQHYLSLLQQGYAGSYSPSEVGKDIESIRNETTVQNAPVQDAGYSRPVTSGAIYLPFSFSFTNQLSRPIKSSIRNPIA